MNSTIFEFMYPNYRITKPIRLIEFFAGYGSQALALKYLGVEFEYWKICEWAIKSIQAYKDLHFNEEKASPSKRPRYKKEIVDFLYNKGVSNNYNNPMTIEQLNRMSFESLEKIYDNILITNNLVNIQQVKAEDLNIKDADTYTYLLTYLLLPMSRFELGWKR